MRIFRSPALLSMMFVAVFVGTLFVVLSGEEAGSAPAPAPSASVAPAVSHADADISDTGEAECLVDRRALDDLKKRADELDKKAKDLDAREAELKASRLAVEEEFKKIIQVREDVERLQGLQKKDGEERVTKLVETFETMSPKAAASLIISLDEVLAVAVMSKISTQKLAKIMNVMEPERSSRLSELMAGVAQAKKSTSHGVVEATKKPEKGGEKENGTSQNSNAVGTPDGSGRSGTASDKKAEKSG